VKWYVEQPPFKNNLREQSRLEVSCKPSITKKVHQKTVCQKLYMRSTL